MHSPTLTKYLTTEPYFPPNRYLLRPVFQAKYFGRHSLYFADENVVDLYILQARGLKSWEGQRLVRSVTASVGRLTLKMQVSSSVFTTHLYALPDPHGAGVLRSKNTKLGVRSEGGRLVSSTRQMRLSASPPVVNNPLSYLLHIGRQGVKVDDFFIVAKYV